MTETTEQLIDKAIFNPDNMSLNEKLLAAWFDFPPILKTAHVRESKQQNGKKYGGWDYAPLPDIVDMVKPVLKKYHMGFRHQFTPEGGVECVIYDDKDNCITSGPFIIPAAAAQQKGLHAYGSSVTYSRRFTLMAVLGLVADDDDDGMEAVYGKPQPQQNNTAPQNKPQPQKPLDIDAAVKAINNATDMKQAGHFYDAAMGRNPTDAQKAALNKAYTDRREKFRKDNHGSR